jgi:hypothetical protein
MLVISNFKDYYDFLIGKYGIDKKIVFNRTNFETTTFYNINCSSYPSHIYEHERCIYFYWLVICSKLFLVMEEEKKSKILSEEDLNDQRIWNQLMYSSMDFLTFKKRNQRSKDMILKSFLNVEEKDLIKIHKKIKSPIFMISRTGIYNHVSYVEIFERCPNLSKIKGIPLLIPAEQLYVDIVSFIGNVINSDEDKIVNISNKDKIVKGGFDLVTSFRNM